MTIPVKKYESVILKLCACGRIFDIVSGETTRVEDAYYPLKWIPSKQPCGKCDKEFYSKRAWALIEKERLNGTEDQKGET